VKGRSASKEEGGGELSPLKRSERVGVSESWGQDGSRKQLRGGKNVSVEKGRLSGPPDTWPK